MVFGKIDDGEALVNKKWSRIIFLLLLGIFLVTLTLIICILIKTHLDSKDVINEFNEILDDGEISYSQTIKEINFQPIIDTWARSTNGDKSVVIYDLELNKLVGSYNISEKYNTASLYKLFVVYEGYRRLQNGEWDKNTLAGSTGYTILECLDKSIRESYSPCAETLWAMIGHTELDEIMRNNFKITDSDISALISTPNDILKIMKLFYDHSEIEDAEYLAVIKDSFLNQPTTEYNWRQGLPSGFSEKVKVYNKVGWDYNENGYWNVYHDAAMVEFAEENRHFIVVVMTSRVPFQKIRALGTEIENSFNQ